MGETGDGRGLHFGVVLSTTGRGDSGGSVRAGRLQFQAPDARDAAAVSAQHSLLLKVKSRLHDPLDSLASWDPEVGPCDDGGDSFLDGWKFVQCDGSTVTQL